jgi:uridine phosphorylase
LSKTGWMEAMKSRGENAATTLRFLVLVEAPARDGLGTEVTVKEKKKMTSFCFVHLLAVVFAVAVGLSVCAIRPEQCTIITNPEPLPPQCIIGGSPARIQYLVENFFDYYNKTIDFRGYQLYVGAYKGMPLCAMNHEIGGPSAAFIVEELAAHGVNTIIRVGTSDIPVDPSMVNDVYLIESETGMVGVLRDYGYPPSDWDMVIPAHPEVFAALQESATTVKNVTAHLAAGYLIDAYYAFNFPAEAAYDPKAVADRVAEYEARSGGGKMMDRDMEVGAVFTVARLRGMRYGAVLQCVVKGGNRPAQPGVTGLPVALNALLILTGNGHKIKHHEY